MESAIAVAKAQGLKARDVADRLGISVRMVWREISAGRLRAVRMGERTTRVLESDLAAYVESLEPVGAAK